MFRLPDPTFTEPLRNSYANRWSNTLSGITGTIITQPNINIMLQAVYLLISNWESFLIVTFMEMLQQSYNHGLFYASQEVNRLSPMFQTTAGRTPQDNETFNELLTEGTKYIRDLGNDTRTSMTEVIEEGLKQNWTLEQIGTEIERVSNISKSRAITIAQTETIHAFNEATRQRWHSWGVKKYRYYTNLDPKVCLDPKTLADGTIASQGCEGLHNTEWQIEDTVHRPPIHPRCRCTILPVVV